MAASLSGAVGELSRRVVELVWERIPGYQPPRMRTEELAEAVTPNLESVIARLADEAPDPADRERARRIGVSRALQGVPLDAVVLSYRCAERVITDAFVDAGKDLTGDELRDGLRRIADAFDDLATTSIEAYRVTTEEVTAHYDRLAGDLVTGLTAGTLRTQQVQELAASLDWEESHTDVRGLALATGEGEVTDVVALQREVLAVLGRGREGRIVAGSVDGCDVLLVPGELGGRVMQELARTLEHYGALAPHLTVGGAVASLSEAGTSCRQALSAMRAVRRSRLPARVVTYEAMLIDVLAGADREAAAALVERYLRPLKGRPQLRETLEQFARCDLSISRTAEALIVHPNTVLYRLGRIRDLTGVDPRSAMNLFAFIAALRAEPALEDA
ncbi:PucR family transcriptional regulator [Egicoccus sp. AB-alg2]|uniref:PucR family transcriptional regulator n=1 Tax=Egicoccus sp. AB-alg2 TaxID=3242693 RepID=UPI00359CC5C5